MFPNLEGVLIAAKTELLLRILQSFSKFMRPQFDVIYAQLGWSYWLETSCNLILIDALQLELSMPRRFLKD